MAWLWIGIEGPHLIPEWAYDYVAKNSRVSPGSLLCVEQIGYKNDAPVTLIRVFDPTQVPPGTNIVNFASLDQLPELILYEGYMEHETGETTITMMGGS